MSYLNTRPQRQVLRSGQGRKQLMIEKVIAETASVVTGHSRLVSVPSGRLNCTIELFWDTIRLTNTNQIPDLITNGVASYIASATNSAVITGITDPVSRSNDSSLYVSLQSGTLHTILPATTLPLAYELTTGVKQVSVAIVITAPTVNGNPIFPVWAMRCRYEPNTDIDDDELALLFNDCSIS